MNCGFCWSCSRFSYSFSNNEEIIGLPRAAWRLGMLFAMPLWYRTCKQRGFVGFGMVFAGDISDVMSDEKERLLFEACKHKHTTSRFIIHLAKAELAVPFFYTDIYYIVYKIHQKASFFQFTTRNGIPITIFFTSLQNFSVA